MDLSGGVLVMEAPHLGRIVPSGDTGSLFQDSIMPGRGELVFTGLG